MRTAELFQLFGWQPPHISSHLLNHHLRSSEDVSPQAWGGPASEVSVGTTQAAGSFVYIHNPTQMNGEYGSHDFRSAERHASLGASLGAASSTQPATSLVYTPHRSVTHISCGCRCQACNQACSWRLRHAAVIGIADAELALP